jgi:hypothetical protein
MSTAWYEPHSRSIYGNHEPRDIPLEPYETDRILGSEYIYPEPERTQPKPMPLIPADGEAIKFTEDPIILTPNGSAKSEVVDRNSGVYLGSIPSGGAVPLTGQVWVKNNTGEIVQANANSDNIVGTYLGKVEGAAAVTEFAGHNHRFTLSTNTSSGTTNLLGDLQYTNELTYGTTSNTTPSFRTVPPGEWIHVTGTYDGGTSTLTGPVRTATYEATAGAAETFIRDFSVTWHVDYGIQGSEAFVWDGGKVISQEQIDKANNKSLELLKKWLSTEEYHYLMEEGNLELPSQHEKNTVYIINKDPMKRIGIKKAGKLVEKSLCIHADHTYAIGDALLANIMLLKTDEKKFLKTANVHDYFA